MITNRITPEQVVESMREMELKAKRGNWFSISDPSRIVQRESGHRHYAYDCACGLGAIYAKHSGHKSTSIHSISSYLADTYNVTYNYIEGFVRGFDYGKAEESRLVLGEDGGYLLGVEDGKNAWELCVKEGLAIE